MELTVYFRRTDNEGLVSARLCLGLARALWRDYTLNSDPLHLNQDTKDYTKALAVHLEYLAKKARQPQRGETRHSTLMEELREAHTDAKNEAGNAIDRAKFLSIWKEIFKSVDAHFAFGRNERLQIDQWYCRRKERPSPGPVLDTFFEETERVLEVLQTVYENAIGQQDRVHANIEIETIACSMPSQAGLDPATRPQVTGRISSERRAHSERNPDPPGKFWRSRRIIVGIPYPCDRMTAFAYEWVIAHEIGVHLFSQLANKEGPSKDGKYLAFTEGFMDAVILNVLEDSAMCANGVPSGISADIVRGGKLRSKSRVSSDLPIEMPSERKALWREQVPNGIECWALLKELAASVDVETRAGLSPEVWARKVALKLNALDLSKEERAKFVDGLRMIYAVSDDPFHQQQLTSQIDELADYLADMLIADSLGNALAVMRDCFEQVSPFAGLPF